MAAPHSIPSHPDTISDPQTFASRFNHLAEVRRKLHRDLLLAKLRALRASIQINANPSSSSSSTCSSKAALDLARFAAATSDQYPPSHFTNNDAKHTTETADLSLMLLSTAPRNYFAKQSANHLIPPSTSILPPPTAVSSPTENKAVHVILPLTNSPVPIAQISRQPESYPPSHFPISTSNFQKRTYYPGMTALHERHAPVASPLPRKEEPYPHRNVDKRKIVEAPQSHGYASYRVDVPVLHSFDSTRATHVTQFHNTRTVPGAVSNFGFQRRTNYPFRLTYRRPVLPLSVPHLDNASEGRSVVVGSVCSERGFVRKLEERVQVSKLREPLLGLVAGQKGMGAFFKGGVVKLGGLKGECGEEFNVAVVVGEEEEEICGIGRDGRVVRLLR